MANISKAILDLAPFGIGTAAMTAALLGDGSEAEAAALPGFRQAFLDAVAQGSNKTIKAGTFEPEAFERLRRGSRV